LVEASLEEKIGFRTGTLAAFGKIEAVGLGTMEIK